MVDHRYKPSHSIKWIGKSEIKGKKSNETNTTNVLIANHFHSNHGDLRESIRWHRGIVRKNAKVQLAFRKTQNTNEIMSCELRPAVNTRPRHERA